MLFEFESVICVIRCLHLVVVRKSIISDEAYERELEDEKIVTLAKKELIP